MKNRPHRSQVIGGRECRTEERSCQPDQCTIRVAAVFHAVFALRSIRIVVACRRWPFRVVPSVLRSIVGRRRCADRGESVRALRETSTDESIQHVGSIRAPAAADHDRVSRHVECVCAAGCSI